MESALAKMSFSVHLLTFFLRLRQVEQPFERPGTPTIAVSGGL